MPWPRRLSPISFVCTPTSVNFAFDSTNSPRSCSLSITFFFSGGITSFACSCAAPSRIGFSESTASLSRSSMRPFCMFTSTSILPAGHTFEADHRAVRGQARVEKRRVDLRQIRVAVRAVDDGGEAGFQRNRQSARVDLELRRVGRALHLDAVERAAELSRRAAARPASPSMVSRLAFANTYLPLTGVRAGCATFHGPKVPDVSISPFGTGIGERRDVRNRLVDAERIHHEMMDGEDLRLACPRASE